MVLVIAVEMFVGLGEHGLGRAIYEYQATYRIPEAYAAVLLAGAIGILLNLGVNTAQNRMLRWLPNAHE
jgi:ABC-type nitrate/sulfonate/bicarbonate transport system permease component